jgi:SAM-dependent methyltransferase
MSESPATALINWVPETRFGTWFQSHWMWTDYVLKPACDDLVRLIAGDGRRYPKILDGGCGAGHAFARLAKEFDPEQIIGIEIDPDAVTAAELRGIDCERPVSVVHGSVEHISMDDASIDMIFCHQTIHHVVDPQRTVGEFFRILKPGGVLLVSESCQKFISSLMVRALFRHPVRVPHSAQDFLELLRNGGFAVSEDMISYPNPFWTYADFGLLAKLGIGNIQMTTKRLLNCIAIKE